MNIVLRLDRTRYLIGKVFHVFSSLFIRNLCNLSWEFLSKINWLEICLSNFLLISSQFPLPILEFKTFQTISFYYYYFPMGQSPTYRNIIKWRYALLPSIQIFLCLKSEIQSVHRFSVHVCVCLFNLRLLKGNEGFKQYFYRPLIAKPMCILHIFNAYIQWTTEEWRWERCLNLFIFILPGLWRVKLDGRKVKISIISS